MHPLSMVVWRTPSDFPRPAGVREWSFVARLLSPRAGRRRQGLLFPARYAEPLGPKWLREAIGDHYFQEARVIWVLTDEKLLAEIAKLRGVEELPIDASILTDEDSLRCLARASDLNSLKVERGIKRSPLNLTHLRDVSTLRTRTLDGLKIGDDEIYQPAAIEQLERLTIEQTLVTQGGVDRLQVLRPDFEIEFALRVISPSLFPYIEGSD
ncbi:MAG: hypothetical protein H8E66_08195 [Planctomycetes bacterium]|nr:hypothetical protein [Planctomycetota bacterium]